MDAVNQTSNEPYMAVAELLKLADLE